MAKKENKRIIVGIDEAGRGPLAGPVLAVVITVPANSKFQITNSKQIPNSKFKISNKNLRDSKKMSLRQREMVYKILKNNSQVKWGIGRVSEKVIDKINIFQATKLAMIRAVKSLEKKIGKKVDSLLIDGNFSIDLDIPQKSIIKGDEKIFLIKLASIVAKVERDRIMFKYNKKYPQYGFDKHKGYGTKLHFKMLKKYGSCQIHRKTFAPVKNY